MDDAQYLNLMAKMNNIVARLDHISLQVTPPVSIPSQWPADVKIHDQGILTSSSTEITHPTWMSSTTTTTTKPTTSARRRKRKGKK